jgi:hypothetical protein
MTDDRTEALRATIARLRRWLADPDAYLTARLRHDTEHGETEMCSAECDDFDPAWPLPAPGRAPVECRHPAAALTDHADNPSRFRCGKCNAVLVDYGDGKYVTRSDD